MLVALEAGDNVAALASASPAIVVPETLDPINLLGVLRRARGSFVIVTNEFGVVQGWLRRWTYWRRLPASSRTLTKRRKLSSTATAGW